MHNSIAYTTLHWRVSWKKKFLS